MFCLGTTLHEQPTIPLQLTLSIINQVIILAAFKLKIFVCLHLHHETIDDGCMWDLTTNYTLVAPLIHPLTRVESGVLIS